MAVSAELRDYVLDQLRAVAPVTAKAMFGGVGIYSRGTFFALIAEDVLYFKVDETTRKAYEERGSQAFNPFGTGTMGYYALPEDILEDSDELREWMHAALAVARRKKEK
ncbi:MAG TPA: TfoX/Sxy family protein [Thermoanaerobaculia bacterium]